MAPKKLRAVSTYIEVFILMAIVLAGSALVYVAAASIASSSQVGASLQISGAAIRQGAGVAVETMTIANTGAVAITSFTITTAGVTSSATFYLSLLNPLTGSPVSSSCGPGTNPLSVLVCCYMPPGQSIIATVTIDANVFTVVGRYALTVSASPASQATALVIAAAA